MYTFVQIDSSVLNAGETKRINIWVCLKLQGMVYYPNHYINVVLCQACYTMHKYFHDMANTP